MKLSVKIVKLCIIIPDEHNRLVGVDPVSRECNVTVCWKNYVCP